ncbi:farnesyl pyrophosphate synthase-like [Gigantopelta aegis]|uniref:farnesyl pyrophosphate synthase-like n=1 Tax=Gigantopelta aegis TaxID=1735272 RepID=UPI001B88E738|nr:farnesyl pyrophosphate synthase-like [Gigantopelta aegis]
MATEHETKKFMEVLPTLLDYITGPELMNDDVVVARKWFKKALEYTNTNVYPFYGQMVVTFYKHLCPQCTDEELHLARVLGWCVEIWKNAGLMGDDTIDGQTVREGKPTWHTFEGVGSMVTLDCGFYYCTVYKLLKKHFGKSPCYVRLFQYFTDSTFWEFVAVCQDMKSDWRDITSEKCESLNKVKSSVYMCLPLAFAMSLSGITDDQDYEDVERIFQYIGHWQQDQNDYMDFYGEKMGTDIQEGRCTWLFGQALTRSSQRQLNTLKANYGQSDPDCVAAIKSLYEQLDLKSVFADHQKRRHGEAKAMIDKYHGAVPKQLFVKFLNDMVNFKYV